MSKEEKIKALKDMTSGNDYAKATRDQKKGIKKAIEYVTNESVNEGKKYKAKELNNLWYGVYGEPLSNYSSFLSELEYNYRRGISKEEIANLWDKHYGEDMEQDYSGFYDKLEESVNEGVFTIAGGVVLGILGSIFAYKGLRAAKNIGGAIVDNGINSLMQYKRKLEDEEEFKTKIKPVADRFAKDRKLADMYDELPSYLDSWSDEATQQNKERTKALKDIAKYIKSKLSKEEEMYFKEISELLRTGRARVGRNIFSESVSKSRNVLTLESFLNEALPTQEIDPDKFPDQWKKDKQFFRQGYKDGSNVDDTVETKPVKLPASQLKPSQDAVYLGKALGMAIGGVEGGSLDAIISSDNRILDGHHRWAATIFNNPKARVGGVQAQLKIGDLIPVLRQAGDALGNNRGLPPKGGDVNIFKATLQDVRDAVYNGKHMNPEFYNREQAVEWFERTGEQKIQNSLNILQRVGPPAGAPPRAEMPRVTPDQVKNVANKLAGGAIDVRKPYVGDPEVKNRGGLQNYLK